MLTHILIIINCIFVVHLSTIWFMNIRAVMHILEKIRIKYLSSSDTIFDILALNIIFYVTSIVILSITISLNFSLFFISFMLFNWSILLYFLNQRFASLIDRSVGVSRKPFIFIKFIFISIILLGVALWHILSLKWILGIIPLWFVYGYMCAEISIKKRMRNMNCDRKMAIFAINSDLGRDFLFKGKKYPFP